MDDEDYEVFKYQRWYGLISKTGKRYAAPTTGRRRLMHRIILNATRGWDVDHKNGNTLDNRRANLRLLTHAQNMQNRQGATKASKSGMRGVTWREDRQVYRVTVKVNGRQYFCGSFKDRGEAEAAAIAARSRLMTHADGR